MKQFDVDSAIAEAFVQYEYETESKIINGVRICLPAFKREWEEYQMKCKGLISSGLSELVSSEIDRVFMMGL